MSSNDDSLDPILVDYVSLNDAYAFRDQTVWQQFMSLMTLFTLLGGLLVIIDPFVAQATIKVTIYLILGITGFIAMIAISTDMASNSSCKVAIRKQAEQVECLLQKKLNDKDADGVVFKLWTDVIPSRAKFREERFLKGKPTWEKHETELSMYIWASRLIEALWLFLLVFLIASQYFQFSG